MINLQARRPPQRLPITLVSARSSFQPNLPQCTVPTSSQSPLSSAAPSPVPWLHQPPSAPSSSAARASTWSTASTIPLSSYVVPPPQIPCGRPSSANTPPYLILSLMTPGRSTAPTTATATTSRVPATSACLATASRFGRAPTSGARSPALGLSLPGPFALMRRIRRLTRRLGM